MIFSDIDKWVKFNISEDFTDMIGGEYIKDGVYSGELFRKLFLEPYLSLGYKVYIEVGSVHNISYAFIRGAFKNISEIVHSSIKNEPIVFIINNSDDNSIAEYISEFIEITTIITEE